MNDIEMKSNFPISTADLFSLWNSECKVSKSYKRTVKSGVVLKNGCYLVQRLFYKTFFSWGAFKSRGSIEYFVNEIYIEDANDIAIMDFITISKRIFEKLKLLIKNDEIIVFVLLIQTDHSLMKFYVQRKNDPLVMTENLNSYSPEKIIRIEIK